jgi:hypothetical protein
VELLDEGGAPTGKVALGSAVTIRVYVEYLEDVDDSAVGITLRNDNGLVVFSTDTALEKVGIEGRRKGERIAVHFSLNVPLQPGTYGITAAMTRPQSERSRIEGVDAATFEVERPPERRAVRGLVHIPTTVTVYSLDRERHNRST